MAGSERDNTDGSHTGDLELAATVSEPGAEGQTAPGDGSAPDSTGERPATRYRLRSEHARGGIGRVLVARDKVLDRTVAIKELLSPHPDAEARFLREARLTARLQHPAIVPVHDAGRWSDNGNPFYSMKLVSGSSLAEAITETTNFDQRLARVPDVLAVAEAIAYAHSQRIIHRDIKPANVIVGEFGETLVIDWGLAKDLNAVEAGDTGEYPGSDSSAAARRHAAEGGDGTTTGTVLGTPLFMPPEQARGEPVDERADVYALGAMLYHVLSGKLPHEGKSTAEVLDQVMNHPATPLREHEPAVPADLVAIVETAMAREPADRYPSAREFAADLRRFQTGQLVGAHRYSWSQLARRWVARHRSLAVATLLFLVLAIAGISWFLIREQGLRRAAERARDTADSERRHAEAERVRADTQTLALLEQQGRAELDRGRPHRAAVYLSAAFLRAPDSRALRFLLSEALRPLRAQRRRWAGHRRDVVYVRYSPDDRRLATASEDGQIKLWDAGTAELLQTWDHGKPLHALEFNSDGSVLAGSARDSKIRLWNTTTGQSIAVIDDKDPYRVAFTPDDELLVVGAHDGSLRIYEVATEKLVFEDRPHSDRLGGFAFSPDGETLATVGWDGKVILWDWRARRPRRTITGDADMMSDAVYSRDGAYLLTAAYDGLLSIYRSDTGAKLRSIRQPESALWPLVDFTPDGRSIISVTQDGLFRVWHSTSGYLLYSVDAAREGKIFHGDVRGDGREVVTVGLYGDIGLWHLGDDLGYRILGGTRFDKHDIFPSTYADGGRKAVLATADGRVMVRDTTTGAVLSEMKVPGEAFSIAPDPAVERVAVSARPTRLLPPRLWDLKTGEVLAEFRGHESAVYNLAGSRDGKLVATASWDQSVRVWNARTGELLPPVLRGDATFSAVTFDLGGERIATADANGRVVLWDRRTGGKVWNVAGHATWVQDIEFSHDGRRIVTAGRQDHTVKVWDAATGALQLTLSEHANNVMRASFSADGSLIATASVDQTARLWDSESGDLLRTIRGPSYTAELDPAGRELLTTGYSDYAVIWDISVDERSPRQLAELVARQSPWRLIDGRLQLDSSPAHRPADAR